MKEEASLSEKRLRLIFEQSPYGLQVFDSKGNCIEANRAWEKLWGIKLEEVNGYNILKDKQLMSGPNADKIKEAFQGKHVVVPPHFYDPSKVNIPGRSRWVQATYYPIMSNNHKLEEVVLILLDVSEMKENERMLKEKNDQLVKINNAMVGRELKMLELKKEIKMLKAKLAKVV